MDFSLQEKFWHDMKNSLLVRLFVKEASIALLSLNKLGKKS